MRARSRAFRQRPTHEHRLAQSPGAVVLHAPQDGPRQPVRKTANGAGCTGRRLSPDAARSSQALHGSGHEVIHHPLQAYARGDVHERRAVGLGSLLKLSWRGWWGLSPTHLPGSVGVWPGWRNVRPPPAFEQAALIFKRLERPRSPAERAGERWANARIILIFYKQ